MNHDEHDEHNMAFVIRGRRDVVVEDKWIFAS
jgi:hypothetical protein